MASASKTHDQLDVDGVSGETHESRRQQMQYRTDGLEEFPDTYEVADDEPYQNVKPFPEQQPKQHQDSNVEWSREHYQQPYGKQDQANRHGEMRQNGGVGKDEFTGSREVPSRPTGNRYTDRRQPGCQSYNEPPPQRSSVPRPKPREYHAARSQGSSKSPDARHIRPQRTNNVSTPPPTSRAESAARSCCPPCYDTVSQPPSVASPRQGVKTQKPNAKSLPDQKRTKPPPEAFCRPCTQPEKQQPLENRTDSHYKPIDVPPKKPREHCAGCNPPPPQPMPRARGTQGESLCSCEPNVQQTNRSADYAEFRKFDAISMRNPLVVRSHGCLSQCPTQGGSAGKKKSKPKSSDKHDKHGFHPCQAEHQSHPADQQVVSTDYAELQSRSGRFIQNPLTVSNCACNMQPRVLPQPHTKNVKDRQQTPYCSNETIEDPNNKHSATSVKPAPSARIPQPRCTRKMKFIPCPAYSFPPLINNNQCTRFVPESWFDAPNLTRSESTFASETGSALDLPAKESDLPSNTQPASCSYPLENRRSTKPNNRHVSGCNTETSSKRRILTNLKTRRICLSKLSTKVSATDSSRRAPSKAHPTCSRMPLIALRIGVKHRRLASSSQQRLKTNRLAACAGTRIKLRGGKLAPTANRTKPNVPNRSSRGPPTAVRRDRAQSQVTAQSPQCAAEQRTQPKPRCQPQSAQQQMSMQATEFIAPSHPAQPNRQATERRDRTATTSADQGHAQEQEQEWTQKHVQAPPEEWPGPLLRPPSWAAGHDAGITSQRRSNRSSEAQPLPVPNMDSNSRSGCQGTSIHHFYRGSFLSVRSNMSEAAHSSGQVAKRRRTSLIEIAQHMLMPKLLKKSIPKGSSFVVPSQWSSIPSHVTAIVELHEPDDSRASAKMNWSWRKLVPNWLLSQKAKATSA